ncbi:MAG: gluconate 2-dehydrogenase subunit 3 family protein [Acidobacteriota bacterium]|nr:gluconate 2-dehydrogenase subunit 3 family protein [Acidobacteriota bacterium]
MNTRRDALRILASASAAIPTLTSAQETKEVGDQPGHLHAGPAIKVPVPSKPTFFQPAEFRTIEALSERIIPRSDTPGAKDTGVALLIDKAILAKPALVIVYRSGIADLNALADASYGNEFASLTEEEQINVLAPLSLDTESPVGKFFAVVKDMTIDAYYKTEAGLKTELGWHGNTYLATFPGCDHPEHQS